MQLGISTYTKEDYYRVLQLSTDRSTMCQTWEEWKEEVASLRRNMLLLGATIVDVPVTPAELLEYCRLKGLDLNGPTRAEFVTYKMELEAKKKKSQ